ncbi:BEACH domain-containing protein B isoform X2 [Oryza sativa Japonica Group]|uniref:BEACH domain-containing protein B isoform X2 n=1 Tax=Oryza sativa subsp. japonica TaxID=39947 RepID=UPI000E1B9569|nr:BEACH domain-containing protein B isoform X2 [Oryza sativa Japonica Group]KAF2928095.1 hypothetical protein DAI22_06g253400 [Oryza sativa Japonica Group]
MNIVRGVADLLRKAPAPPPAPPAVPSSSFGVREGSFHGADQDVAPSPRVVFSDSTEERVLNTLWKKYENALNKAEKEKSLQIFVLQFVQTFRDWGPYHNIHLVDQEQGSDETVVGCSHGHPSEVILILIQEMSIITSTIAESGNSPESSPNYSEQPGDLGLSTERLHVLECLTILTRSMHNCRVFSYYGGVKKVTSLLKAAVAQLKIQNSLLAADNHVSCQAVENIKMMLNMLKYIVTIISNFMKLEPTILRIPHFLNSTKCASSKNHLATVTPSTSESGIFDTLQRWQQRAIVLVMGAGGVNSLVELLRVIQRLNSEQWTDLSLHFITLCTLRSTISGTRAQNHVRSIGGLEILLDGLGLPSSKFSVLKNSSIPKDERVEVLLLQILYLEILSEAVFGNVNNLQFLCENGRVHKFANCICWPAFMILEFHRQRDNTGPSLALDSISGPIYFLDITEWREYSVKLSNALCSFIIPSKVISYCRNEIACNKISLSIPSAYREQSVRWFIRVLMTVFLCIKACTSETELPNHIKILAKTLQLYMIRTFRMVLVSKPTLLTAFREEGVWDLIFSENCFYFGSSVEDMQFHIVAEVQNEDINGNTEPTDSESLYLSDVNILQLEAISFLEYAATLNENKYNLPECSALLEALEHCIYDPVVVSILLKSFRVILQLATEQTLVSFKSLDVITGVLKAACQQAKELQNFSCFPSDDVISSGYGSKIENIEMSSSGKRTEYAIICIELALSLFKEYVTISSYGRILILHNPDCIECLFNLFQEKNFRKHVLEQIFALFRLPPSSKQDHAAKLQLCSKYLENFTRANEKEKVNSELLVDLLVNMREIIMMDRMYYQNLFRDGGCFLYIVSLLNGTFNEATGEQLVLNVLETLTLLLEGNDASKASFRMLVGVGYQTLQSLLLDFYKWLPSPSERLLHALLSMLVDGKFEINEITTIKNEDVVILVLNILQKSSTSLQHYGLVVLQQLLKQSIANRTSCFRAGLLSYLLDWFSVEERDDTVGQIADLIQIIGAHSISGKDIRKIFALLRCGKIVAKKKHSSLLLTCLSHMLKEKGPEAFFEFDGHDSGIEIKSPFQWPYNRGLSFSCWLRVENFPENGMMGLFSFFTEDGKGCSAVLSKSALVYESINQKRECVLLPLKLPSKEWIFLFVTHTIGRAFSGGSHLRCYVDGNLVSSEKCSYPKMNEAMTHCTIGTKLMPVGEQPISIGYERTFAFTGQMGPIYVFSDALSSEQIKGIYNLGPSYMYSFHGDDSLYRGILDARDGISSKIIFGFNAQASDSRSLFSVSSALDSADRSTFEATIMGGTKLCSRHLPQDIIYCVGGVSVFFPLFSCNAVTDGEQSCHTSVINGKLRAEVIELVASVLDANVSNQQQMYLLSGLSIMGFLLQSATPKLLNIETLSALKYMFDVLRNCGMSKVLLKDAILQIYLNPQIWVHSSYEVQRDLYMFLLKYFETDGRFLPLLCGLPRIIDIVCQYYSEYVDCRCAVGSKSLLRTGNKQVVGDRPKIEEICKLRLLLLSLAEMSLKLQVCLADIRALASLFERNQDVACVEDILKMIIRALSEGPVLSSFLEHVNCLGGCCIFINLLKRESEPVRLLGLQLVGKLMAGIPSEKKGAKLFTLPIGQSRPLSDNSKNEITAASHLFFYTISERLFKFPLSYNLCAAFFNVLLGGTSPIKVLQEYSQSEQSKNKSCSTSHLVPFFLPQILVCIFRYLQSCQDSSARIRILSELIGLLDSNPTNIEALMEHSWNYWLETSTKLDVLKEYSLVSKGELDNVEIDEVILVRKLYALVLAYYLSAVKGGWHQLEDTVNYFLLKFGQGQLSSSYLLRDILDDIVGSLLQTSSEENIILSQPCCDNVLYLLKLIQELLFNQIGIKLLFPSNPSEESLSSIKWKDDIKSTLNEILIDESHSQYKSFPWKSCQFADEDEKSEDWWNFFDKVWDLICNLNGKGPNKLLPKGPNIEVPSLGQRARGLVESLNVPATEMAAAVVSGGIGTALGAKINRFSEKATLLREEIFPRVFFHLVILYLCKAGLENASKCVLQFMSLLPVLISEDEQSKNKLHFLIWSLLITRSQYGQLDDGARYHVLSHLILETIICGKSMLVPNILGRDDSMEIGNSNKDTGFILNFVQKDRVLAAATVEVKHMKAVQADRLSQLDELQSKLNEHFTEETQLEKMIEDNIHISITSALSADDKRKIAFRLAFDEDQQIVADKWIHISRALIDERGPWSANPFPNDVVTHWKLDKTEDKWRRRLKLKRNYKFDERLCQPSYSRNESTEACVDQSSLSTKVPLKLKRFLLKGVRAIFEDNAYEPIEDTNDTGESSQSSLLENQNPNNVSDLSDYRTAVQNKKESASNNGDNDYTKVLCSVHCVLITPKRKLAGQLDITRTVLHFSFEFLVEGTGGSSVFSKFKEIEDSDCKSDLGSVERLDGGRDYVIKTPNGVLMQKQSNKIKHHRRWNITKIKAVHWTRYLLQYTATEIFFDDSNAPIFLNFSSQKDAKNAGSLLVSLRNEALFPKGSTKGKSRVISFVDRRVALEMAENARDRWIKREISNFEYLMILNTLAGRSYNDLTQYPVFPWVLTDYTSEKLDFNKSSTFRDLSKPIGALDEKRFEVFEDRYVNFDDPDIPSFYYGSHYSTMGIVLHYLLRLEPFTTLHRSLQGGKFDHADRLFQSIDSAYKNSLSNTSDVKELIPEFFYMPEFLENSNSYHLGVRQDGEPLGDVVLPPWAKGSPEEFIHINREALESEYVSSNLHHWIDLIFGYKQRGQPAVEAANIFYYVTYEGAVDLENMDDLLQKSAIEDQIANFGQTPIQIFRVKHPRRGPPVPIAHPLYFAPQSIALTSSVSSTISHMSALLFIGLLDNTVILMNEGLILSIKLWLTTQLQSGGNFTFSGPQDHFFGIGSDVISPRKIGTFLAENVNFGRQCLATMQINSDKYLILCGNWENSFQIISLSDGRIVQSIRQHKDVVACVAVSSRGNVVATGSYDTTVMIWHAFRGRPSDHVVMERPVHIFCGHDDIITCLFVSTELDIVISGSKDGTCIFHTLREGRYVRSIRHPSGIGLSKLVASQHGRVVFYSESDLSLHMYSINGKHIASSASGGRINCMELSCCGQFLVCAGEHGQIVLHSMHCLDIIRRYDGAGKTITSLSVTPEECILAGTKDGSLLVFSMESPLLRRKSMPRTRIKPPTAS